MNSVDKAVASIRSGLARAPLVLSALAAAAALSPGAAAAWEGEYEQVGRQVGAEVARAAVGGGYGAKANVAGMLGRIAGSMVARPLDEQTKQARRDEEVGRQAREQAIRDAAYEQERRKRDPTYSSTSYGTLAARAQGTQNSQAMIGANLQTLNDQNNQLVEEYKRRNHRATQR